MGWQLSPGCCRLVSPSIPGCGSTRLPFLRHTSSRRIPTTAESSTVTPKQPARQVDRRSVETRRIPYLSKALELWALELCDPAICARCQTPRLLKRFLRLRYRAMRQTGLPMRLWWRFTRVVIDTPSPCVNNRVTLWHAECSYSFLRRGLQTPRISAIFQIYCAISSLMGGWRRLGK